MLKTIHRITLLSIVLAAIVVSLGAYTRLTHAGLGCPDWPGCYGFLSVPQSTTDIAVAEQAFPDRPVEPDKAWNEMIHRYCAGLLGLLIAVLFVMHVKAKQKILLPASLLVLVIVQATLGMLTVTMNLMPLVVMAHLLGGFATFSLLFVMFIKQAKMRRKVSNEQNQLNVSMPLYMVLKVGVLVVVLQIALGGWTAANYAAVSCTQLPICEGDWRSTLDISAALSVPSGYDNYEFGVNSHSVRQSIHILHRLGAILVTITVLFLGLMLLKNANGRVKMLGAGLMFLLTLQVGLGIANIVFLLPLFIAVAHNFIALCLLCYLFLLLLSLSPRSTESNFISINKLETGSL